MKIPDISLLP